MSTQLGLSGLGWSAGAAPAPFPFASPSLSTWHDGRTSIWQACRRLGFRAGERILVPAYSCGAEVDPFVRAGMEIDCYRLLPDLTPDLQHLEELCRLPARGLLVTHYFGFAQPVEILSDLARRHGLALVEDNAHGLYSTDTKGTPLGSVGDAGIFSFHKTLPIPDGGGYVLNGEVDGADSRDDGQSPGLTEVGKALWRLFGAEARRRSPLLASALRKSVTDPLAGLVQRSVRPRHGGGTGEDAAGFGLIRLRPDRAAWRMSRISAFMIRHMDHEGIRASRRRNFASLASRFRGGRRVRPLIPALADGASPWLYPIWAEDRDALSQFLSANGVANYRYWKFEHPKIAWAEFPFERELKRHVITVPVHQGLDGAVMHRIAELLDAWEEGRRA